MRKRFWPCAGTSIRRVKNEFGNASGALGLHAAHGRREYTVDGIDSAELLYELPDGLTRVMGTGLPNLLKGDFRAAGMSHLHVCLDPNCPPFLLVQSDGEYCLFGTRDSAQTESIFNEIG